MQAELGFSIKGTTDAALVEQQCVTAGLPATGLRWLWELKRQLHGPTSGVLAETVPGAVPSSSTSKYDSQVQLRVVRFAMHKQAVVASCCYMNLLLSHMQFQQAESLHLVCVWMSPV